MSGGPNAAAPTAGRPLKVPTPRPEVLRRFLQGDLGSLRVIIAIAVIWAIFQFEESSFLTATNLTNLVLQITAVGLISVGVVLVLLLGEIDLSVGAVSGLCSAIMAVLSVQHGWNPYLAIAAGVLAGTGVGLVQGFAFEFFGIPSFVVTLAGLLAWQGFQLAVLGDTGTVNLTDPKITGLAGTFYSDAVGWVFVAVGIAAFAGARLWQQAGAHPGGPLGAAAGRGRAPHRPGGRGGDRDRGGAELGSRRAARRADPDGVRDRVPVRDDAHSLRPPHLRSGRQRGGRQARRHLDRQGPRGRVHARLEHGRDRRDHGRLAAARREPVVRRQHLLLLAIAGPVVAGTSLFGGRGGVWTALLGAVVIGSISNGMDLLALQSSVQFIVTGAVLLAAVVVDALARRQRSASGRV